MLYVLTKITLVKKLSLFWLNKYCTNESPVFICALHAEKSFDRINH